MRQVREIYVKTIRLNIPVYFVSWALTHAGIVAA
jgi:hypothetical protein